MLYNSLWLVFYVIMPITSVPKVNNHTTNNGIHFLPYLIINILFYKSILSLWYYTIIMVFQHVMCYHIFYGLFLEIFDICLINISNLIKYRTIYHVSIIGIHLIICSSKHKIRVSYLLIMWYILCIKWNLVLDLEQTFFRNLRVCKAENTLYPTPR